MIRNPDLADAQARIRANLGLLYDTETAEAVYQQILDWLDLFPPFPRPSGNYLSEKTVTLISYGDSLQQADENPLATLYRFWHDHLAGLIDTLHILPFYPYSSDDGFSVIDYYAINPELGDWYDVRALGADVRLMFDAVINHMSAQSEWFQAFVSDNPEFQGMFVTESPDTDLSMVTRPRTSPLLTPFGKANGETVHVWTTFSADQVDLNYGSPQTLMRVLDVLLFYVTQGAQVLRLDAIAYMWKQPGTTSIHLPQTHAIIKLMRAVLDCVAPHVVLITETNVPHPENVSYFGDGTDEAQLVYNFTLPPLLLHSLLSEQGGQFCDWLNQLATPSNQTAFFNFTASHDGIGVRPVEGILSSAEVARLLAVTEERGGRVSYKSNPDGSRSPYELNITYFDALADPSLPPDLQIQRFLLSQAIMLTLAGVPAIYLHSLIGSRNDIEGMLSSGIARRINRAKLKLNEVEAQLADPTHLRAKVFGGFRRLIEARTRSRAFHPLGPQQATPLNQGRVLSIERHAPDGSGRVWALFNLSREAQTVQVETQAGVELLSSQAMSGDQLEIEPFGVRWIQFFD